MVSPSPLYRVTIFLCREGSTWELEATVCNTAFMPIWEFPKNIDRLVISAEMPKKQTGNKTPKEAWDTEVGAKGAGLQALR